MKKLVLILISLVTGMLLSGCTFSNPYNKASIAGNVKPFYNKVLKNEINVLSQDQVVTKQESSITFRKKDILETKTGKISTEVSKEFLFQYFNKVNLVSSISDNGYTMVSKIMDYDWKTDNKTLDGFIVKIYLEVTLYKNGKEIMKKEYVEEKSNNVFLIMFFSTRPIDTCMELFHKTLLFMYETQVKPDLVKVMRNN